jgi:hypothetical protein
VTARLLMTTIALAQVVVALRGRANIATFGVAIILILDDLRKLTHFGQ